jgi:1,4-alpha-glucan branching enzyme
MPRKTKQTTQKKKKVTFELTAPDAKRVRLTGDFNSWNDKGITMRRNKTGVWKTGVELTSGDYQYKFIVDDQWWTDPNNEWKVTNSFGDQNSVIKVS